ncbi:MAG: alanine racemase [Enhygromyxa sp.]
MAPQELSLVRDRVEDDLRESIRASAFCRDLLDHARQLSDTPTPFTIYSLDRVRQNVTALRSAMGSDARLHFAVKALYLTPVLAAIAGQVDAFDVQSLWEASFVPGGPPLAFHSPWLDERIFDLPTLGQVCVNSVAQFEALAARRPELPWGPRISLPRCVNGQFIHEDDKFGVASEALVALLERTKEAGAGGQPCSFIHHHTHSRLGDPESAARVSSVFVEHVSSIEARVRSTIPALNLGGGIDGRLQLHLREQSLNAIVEAIVAPIREQMPGRELVLEFGRVAVEDSAVAVGTISEVRTSSKRDWAVVDLDTGFLIPLEAARFKFVVLDAEPGPVREVALVDGTCSPKGLIARQWTDAILRPGTRVAVLNVGGYTYSCAGPFHSPPPPVWVVDAGESRCAVARETMMEGCRALVG